MGGKGGRGKRGINCRTKGLNITQTTKARDEISPGASRGGGKKGSVGEWQDSLKIAAALTKGNGVITPVGVTKGKAQRIVLKKKNFAPKNDSGPKARMIPSRPED